MTVLGRKKVTHFMTILHMKSNPVQQSTSQQFPPSRGAGGRGEAFNIFMTPSDQGYFAVESLL